MTTQAISKYRLIAELGHGGMADVFLAALAGPAGSGFSKLIVLKRLRKALVEDEHFATMLLDEARIAARLNHPNVVQTNEVGEEDGQYFIAMEYLDGQPLHRIRNRARQDTSIKWCTEFEYVIIADALAGLHHAHELRDYDGSPLDIVHRDVTPHNVFVTYAGHTKVVDFGIAKATGRSVETAEGVLKGKLRYMSPEQATMGKLDRRADVFAAGLMLWEAATGKRYWGDAEDLEILSRLMQKDLPPSPRTVDSNVPEEIDAICRKALAPEVDDRYATAEDFRVDLEAYLQSTSQLMTARRELGPRVGAMFAEIREKLRRVIEAQLSALERSSSASIVRLPDSGLSGTITPPVQTVHPDSVRSMTAPGTSLANDTEPPTMLRTQSRRRSARMLIVGASALAAVSGVTLALLRKSPPPPPVTTAAVTQASTSTEAPLAEEVEVELRAEPQGARLYLDGVSLANPFTTKMPKSQLSKRVRAEADGYTPQEIVITFDAPVVKRTLTLARVAKDESHPTAAVHPPAQVGRPTVRPASTGASANPHPTAPAETAAAPATTPTTQPTTVPIPATLDSRGLPQRGKPRGDIDKSVPWK